MASSLSPCPGCDRHIMPRERACPFCGAALPEGFGNTAPRPFASKVPSRAALLFAGATALAACGGETTTGSESDAAEGGSARDGQPDGPVALYGPAPVRDAAPDNTVPPDDGGAVVLYGPAPVNDGGNG